MELAGKRVLVVGAGKSGLSAARFLLARGAQVTLTDSKDAKELHLVRDDSLQGLRLALGAYPDVTVGWDFVVTSPGVPPDIAPLAGARKAGIPVTGEFELATQYAHSPVVAITGTNGKTTTTALCGQIFRDAGLKTLVAGNIGIPLTSEVEGFGANGIIVAEVSSFQLETATTFHPKVAVILNITPDHLDRHGTLENYARVKAAVFANQTPEDWTILNFDDPYTASLAGQSRGRVIFFSRKHSLDRGVFVRNGRIVIQDSERSWDIMDSTAVSLPGNHNLENSLAAAAAAWVMGVPRESIAQTLALFPGVPHRLEFVAEVGGVRYVNDSKGTNPDASTKALEAYEDPIVLIAGGRNKGNDFDGFARLINEKVRVLVVLGESAGQIADAAQKAGFTDILQASDLQSAVRLAHGAAQPGEVVLLSPACASWDMFRSYEERGDLFRRTVLSLARRPADAG